MQLGEVKRLRSRRELDGRGLQVPRQELIERLDIMILSATEHIGEPGLGIDVVAACSLYQCVRHCGALAAAVGAGTRARRHCW